MKPFLAIALALLVVAAPAESAKGKKGNGARVLTRFDRDKSGTINGEEVARVQAAFSALAKLDTDKNGELSEAELAAADVPERRKKKAK